MVRPRINVLFLSTFRFGNALLFQKMKAYTILEQPVSKLIYQFRFSSSAETE